MTATVEQLTDLLDIRFKRIWDERFTNVPDKIGTFWNMQSTTQLTERFSSLGTFGDMEEFSGTIRYDDIYQGYDTTTNVKEFAKGFAITRKLIEYDQTGNMDGKPKALAGALYRKRQTDAARPFNNAASVEGYFYNNTEAVALVSNSHTTTSGASVASGFDNLTTAAFSATSLAAGRIQMVNFRGDRAERISVNPTMIVHPVDLYQTIHEVTQSAGLPDSAYNNSNVHKGAYRAEEWIELSDVNNWFLVDPVMMKEYLIWMDKVKGEFAMIEDFDNLIAKWRCYSMYTQAVPEWRWILGGIVS